jgi:beta-glucosidase-like glycosyl hydrolase
LKHFPANSNEDNRLRSSSDFDERLLREYYSVPFRMGIVEGDTQRVPGRPNRAEKGVLGGTASLQTSLERVTA